MYPSQLIYQAKTKDIVLPDSRDKLCVLCGYPCDGSLLAKDVIKDTFNDLGYLTQPNSLYACIACAKCLDNGEDCLRRQTFFARVDTHNNEQEFINFSGEGVRGRVRDFVLAFDPAQVKGYWLLCITLTGQKHLSFKCVVNTGGGQIYNIQLEEQSVRVAHQVLIHSLGNFELLLMPEFGLNKSEIASGEYPAGKLAKLMASGMYSEFEAIEDLLSEVRVKQPKLMELLGYLAQYSTPFEKVKTDKVSSKVTDGSGGDQVVIRKSVVEKKDKGKTKSDSKTTKRTSGASGQPTLFDMEVS